MKTDRGRVILQDVQNQSRLSARRQPGPLPSPVTAWVRGPHALVPTQGGSLSTWVPDAGQLQEARRPWLLTSAPRNSGNGQKCYAGGAGGVPGSPPPPESFLSYWNTSPPFGAKTESYVALS